MVNHKGQIWIETVIYILIALVMIGAVLAFVNPKIREIQDKLTIDKTIEMLEELDSKISEVGGSIGNQRIINLDIKKGELQIKSNSIIYELKESNVEYSQPVEDAGKAFTNMGKVWVQTLKNNDLYDITLRLDIDETLSYIEGDTEIEVGILTRSSSAYKLSILNKGTEIEIKLIN